MSGGHFDYQQWRINEIADRIEGYGDYVIMVIDSNGYIRDFDNDLDDIFDD